jgi:cation:H+ antiporter
MELLIWSAIFIISVAALVIAARWFGAGARKFFGAGAHFDLALAVLAAALPELAAALAAVLQNRPELAAAIVVGSSLANILLVAGASALAAKNIQIKEEHICIDLPFFAAGTALFFFTARDGQIDLFEGTLMLAASIVWGVYLFSTTRRSLTPRDVITPGMVANAGARLVEIVGSRIEKGIEIAARARNYSFYKAVFLLLAGAFFLVIAANFAIDSAVFISGYLLLPATAFAIIFLAAAAAIPELSENLETIRKKRHEVALGNIFAATGANLLFVSGVAAMFKPLPLDKLTVYFGLPFLVGAAALLAVFALGRKINAGQGLAFLLLYVLFFVKIFNLF